MELIAPQSIWKNPLSGPQYRVFGPSWGCCRSFALIYVHIVRWNYDAKDHTELTVRNGDEVEIIEIIEPGSKVKVITAT